MKCQNTFNEYKKCLRANQLSYHNNTFKKYFYCRIPYSNYVKCLRSFKIEKNPPHATNKK